MAVDPDAPKVACFVTLGGAPYIIRYNVRWPVVVYVPGGVEVRYHTWTAGAGIMAIEKGCTDPSCVPSIERNRHA